MREENREGYPKTPLQDVREKKHGRVLGAKGNGERVVEEEE